MNVAAIKLLYYKFIHWEYWPFQLIYFPIYGLWLYYALKLKSLFFFNTVNPSIKNGGFVMESKKEIYDLIPPAYCPKTILIRHTESMHSLETILRNEKLSFPVVAKPDNGLRGIAVKKIASLEGLKEYHMRVHFNYLIQAFIDLPLEIGVFYVRYPDSTAGKITGIVAKEFVSVTGDGKSTMEVLLNRNPRYRMQLKAFKKEDPGIASRVLKMGEKAVVMPYGSHSRGARFTDCTHIITPELTRLVNRICLQVEGFYYGRLDIMFRSIELLEQGEDFMIVELNGAKSEPTHIYDPKHSIFFAWKVIARHITYMYEISRMNHINTGMPFLTCSKGLKVLFAHQRHLRKLTAFYGQR